MLPWFAPFVLTALADPPTPEAMQAICAGREPCRRASHHFAGIDPLGADMQVVEVLLSDVPLQEADQPSYGGPCHPIEWHLVRSRDDQIVGHRRLLEVCNDGYGASGVGEDRIEVSDNRFVHQRMGGSSWRWSEATTQQLWPERVLETSRSSWRSPMGHTAEQTWSWERLSGWQRHERFLCGDQEDPEFLQVAGVVLPQVPPQAGPGPCAAEVQADDDRGLVIWGERGAAEDGRMRIALHDPRTLVVDVHDDTWVPEADKWIHADHLELWLPDGPDPSGLHCIEPWSARQWGVLADGSVRPGHGDPPTDALIAAVSPLPGGGHRFTITLPADAGPLAVVFSDSDDGTSQERLLATTTQTPRDAHSLLEPMARDGRCTPEGQVRARWDPRFAGWGEVGEQLLAAQLSFRAIDDVDAFVGAWAEAMQVKPHADEASQRWFDTHADEAEPLAWADEQLSGWSVGRYAEGTVVLWELSVDPWTAAAARTPGTADDRFVALLSRAWGNLSFTGLPNWYTLTWDGGGCNDLGDGDYLAVLQLTEGRWPPGLSGAVARVRGAAIDSLVQPTGNFGFCDGDSTELRTPEELHAEVDRILAEIDLTDAERRRLEARRAEGYQEGAYPPEAP